MNAPSRNRKVVAAAVAACFLALVSFVTDAAGDFLSPPPASPLPVDTSLGAGPLVDAPPVRPQVPVRVCDARAPICVHAPRETSLSELTRLRDEAARAFDTVAYTLAFPAPLSDGDAGGDGRFDLYVSSLPDTAATDGFRIRIVRGPIEWLSDHDASSAYAIVSPSLLRELPCVLRSEMVAAMVRASAKGMDLAETPSVVDGFARHVSVLVTGCHSEEGGFHRSELQASPWRAITSSFEGTQALIRYVDEAYSHRYPTIAPALLSMGAGRHGIVIPLDDDLGPAHFWNEPTLFDVLSATLRDQGGALDALLLDFAIARGLDDTKRPALEWTVAASSLPRRLAIANPVEPTGASYVRVDIDVPPASGGIEFDLRWDHGAQFRWSVLKLDPRGRLLGSVPVAKLDRGREVTVDVRRLAGVGSLLLVGVNAGSPGRTFRPDEPMRAPTAFEIGIYAGN